jgi:hypothetical protein
VENDGVTHDSAAVRPSRSAGRGPAVTATADRLGTIARALASEDGLGSVGEALLARGAAATGATAGVVAVLDDDVETLEIVASAGWDDDLLAPFQRFSLDRALPLAEAVRTQRVVVLSSRKEAEHRYPDVLPFLDDSQALAAFPITDEGEVVGGAILRFDVATGARLPDAVAGGSPLTRAVVPALVERVSQLQGALESRVVVEQAKGILAERHGIGMDEAFSRLRNLARSRSERVQSVATAVIEGRLRP